MPSRTPFQGDFVVLKPWAILLDRSAVQETSKLQAQALRAWLRSFSPYGTAYSLDKCPNSSPRPEGLGCSVEPLRGSLKSTLCIKMSGFNPRNLSAKRTSPVRAPESAWQ